MFAIHIYNLIQILKRQACLMHLDAKIIEHIKPPKPNFYHNLGLKEASGVTLTTGRTTFPETHFPSRVNMRTAPHIYTLGCSKKTLLQNKNKRNPARISLGVSLKGSKRIFDFDQVKGVLGSLPF